MRKLYEFFKVLQFQKRIVAAVTGNYMRIMVYIHMTQIQKRIVSVETIRENAAL